MIIYLQVAELEQLRREDADRFQRSYEVGTVEPHLSGWLL